MDPISQGAIGAVATQTISSKKNLLFATLIGWISGMAADLDVFIRSTTDPLLSLEFHRQFTHSLIFIPIGGLICATIFYWLFAKRKEISFRHTYLYCTLGYGTHGLLDACTSYGTLLLWPFSQSRISWNTISIVDPIFTLPVVVFIILAVTRKNRLFSNLAILWVVGYLTFGVIQNNRAENAGLALAHSRGHQPIRIDAKPGFANLLLWKTVYETENHFYIDGVRVGLDTEIYEGDSRPKIDLARDFPWLNIHSQQAKDLERFRWFSEGYIASNPDYPNKVGDIRYSMLPNEIEALWMIELKKTKGEDEHVSYIHAHENPSEKMHILWKMILGKY